MNKKEYEQRRDALALWSTEEAAGNARLAWIDALSQHSGEADAVTIEFGRAAVTLTCNGQVPVANAGVETDIDVKMGKRSVGVHIATDIPMGAAPTNKIDGGFRYPCGNIVIIGGGSTGKTPMAHAMAAACDRDYEVVRYGEPLAGYLNDEREGAAALAAALFTHADVVVDSVKDILATAAGGAMKSGISRGALPLLSRWGSIAAAMGATLYIPLNPSSDDPELVSLLVEAVKSNATMVVFPSGTDRWDYVSRTGEGLRRETGTIRTEYAGNGIMNILSTKRNLSGDAEDKRVMTSLVKLSDESYSDAVRRAAQSLN